MMHPGLEILIRYRDRELPREAAEDVEAHVRDCRACRVELQRLSQSLSDVRKLSASGVQTGAADRYPEFHSRIRQWQRETQPEDRAGKVKDCVAREIGPFLGLQGIRSVLAPVSPDGSNILAEVEPVLAHFLGARAAARLIDHVVDVALSQP